MLRDDKVAASFFGRHGSFGQAANDIRMRAEIRAGEMHTAASARLESPELFLIAPTAMGVWQSR